MPDISGKRPLNSRVQQRSAAFSKNRDICERGFDPCHWFHHPEAVENGVNPFLSHDREDVFPSEARILAATNARRINGEVSWTYGELASLVGIHEAKLTNGISRLVSRGKLQGPGVVIGEPGPNARLRRDHILHIFWLSGFEDGVMADAVQRQRERGLIEWCPDRPGRAPLTRDERALAWAKTGGRCWYCGVQTDPFGNFRVDHIVPVADNGSNDPANLAPSCHDCNAAKAAKHIEVFRAARGGGLFWFEIVRSDNR